MTTCLVLSPHLDDAVLSCGALLIAQAGKWDLTVATVFTEGGSPPFTYATRSALRATGIADSLSYYGERRAEDVAVLAEVAADVVHMGFADAPFRRRQRHIVSDSLGKVVPELAHCYPTFRWDIARGRITRADRPTVAEVRRRVGALVAQLRPDVVLAPIAVGRHVDHVIVRQSPGTAATIYYEDFPYSLLHRVDPAFVRRADLRGWVWPERLAEKEALIRGYRSQVPVLFPDGSIPTLAERYYARKGQDARELVGVLRAADR
jgi:LmbE family N-acetylglucosaminyl deacetylase